MNNIISQATASLGAYATMFNMWTIISLIGIYPLYNAIICALMYVFDYKYIHVSSYSFIMQIAPLINYNTLTTSHGEKIGYIISKDWSLFGYIYVNGNDYGGYVYMYNPLIAQYKLLNLNEDKEMIKYDVDKQYCKLYNYSSNRIEIGGLQLSHVHWNKTQTALQSTVIDRIQCDLLKRQENNTCVVLLTGEPGVGKSMLCRLLAQQLNASLFDEYNPCDPRCVTFTELIKEYIQPTIASPVVIVIEEVDVIIHAIHHGLVVPHINFHISVRNKTDWNNFLDQIDYGQFPNVILIMTTNKPRQWFDDLDPSYMREGRVNLHIDITDVIADMTAAEQIKDKAD